MANTLTLTSPVDHTSDAGFRTWGAEFHAALLSVGLTLTSDTGQINWTTVTRSTIGLSSGYEIWRFNDSLQATSPIFIKFEFGTATGNYPFMYITIGNGSNGSGTLTGLTSSKFNSGGSTQSWSPAFTSTITNYISRFVYNPTLGFFGFVWKIGAAAADCACSGAFIFRSNDSSGAATPTTVNILAQSIYPFVNNTSYYGGMQCLNYSTGAIYPPVTSTPTYGGWYSIHPFASLTTSVGTSINLDPVFFLSPGINISVGLGRALRSEVGLGTVISATLVGSTPHNYIAIGSPFLCNSSSNFSTAVTFVGLDAVAQILNVTVLGMVMLWE